MIMVMMMMVMMNASSFTLRDLLKHLDVLDARVAEPDDSNAWSDVDSLYGTSCDTIHRESVR